ncbi:hypothetical protein SAMN05421747_11654 [Parapedobacter composti]|uniref:Amidinotransferase n=1 Tax=Parapedobacter composti TaxID=623281 RepID=A0A1I1KKF4_9SPHI|nr:arginine deiminase-related protein [Parapedobacter composti]SFC61249.1 hypothetical protein SAMN05421747_11654 [Parapedobacter composti]
MEMTLLMIRPARFGFNAQTAVNNAFQLDKGEDAARIQRRAVEEFDTFVALLRGHGIDTLVVQDTEEPHTPDSVFPNNWISFHGDGTAVLYPMFAENRRLERKQAVFDKIHKRFYVRKIVDYTAEEVRGKYLEGTGSMVLDRKNRLAYACRSPRTDQALLARFCKDLGFHAIAFDAYDQNGTAIYHTNVMMSIADRYAIVCLDAISKADRGDVVNAIENSGKIIIAITQDQLKQFAGNVLQVTNTRGERYLVMSSSAYQAFDTQQKAILESYNPLIHARLNTIEQCGGGSARCMLAEIFLPLRHESI